MDVGTNDETAEADDRQPVIETRGLRMRYGTTDVLRGVDLRVRRGEVVALLGPNGAGKTTTIEILEGFRRRSAGEVRVLGADPDRGGEAWRARLGIVLQSWRDHGRWRVRELLAHLGRYYTPYGTAGRPRPYDPDELTALVGLTEQADTAIARLSGGQRRRLDVAVGLVGRPDLLFLDEPTVGFDPRARQEFHALVHRLSGLEDTTILLTTHDLDEAERLAGRILILVAGRIVADGTAAELTARVARTAEVRYTRDGESHTHEVEDPTGFVRELFARYGERIGDLEVRRPRLEDVYLAMVREFESGRRTEAPGELAEVAA
ncbi:ABC transporter ATP-binding protein [Microbispora sp. ATCC PTA-5024]|uniref:ABC transporter ATP-binding protein n=1 Tax=Microbispora sp. ATCC PTA-5024 TaxID=316330 RepID=UPI0003DD56B2|nr:ABC transporter ATP-binding protein [Microbispora sp. ATCC PTA-5024]ETK31703.1 multidrug ABC transporter ATPase [Microbispora sp. ATCC PTA-5024]